MHSALPGSSVEVRVTHRRYLIAIVGTYVSAFSPLVHTGPVNLTEVRALAF